MTIVQRRRPPLWSFIVTILVVQFADRLLALNVAVSAAVTGSFVRDVIRRGEDLAGIVFVITAAVLVVLAVARSTSRLVNVMLVAYLVVATANVMLNIAALVATASFVGVGRLELLWDVVLAYLSTVLLFSMWYRLLDTELVGGAFEWPVDPMRPEREPGWVDYVFLAFNTNATFGPTSEVVHSRAAKVTMMIQAMCSLVILVVLVARIVGLDS
jgi:hypothetical protein